MPVRPVVSCCSPPSRHVALRLCAVAAVMVLIGLTSDAAEGRKRAVTKFTPDPSAPTVGLFDAIEQGQLAVTVLPKDVHGGMVLIENTSDHLLNVTLPSAFAGVHVLKQFGGGGMQGGMGGMQGGMGGMQGGMGGMGGGQAMGGGMGGMGGGMQGGMGGGMGGMGGMGAFSIPAEAVARVPYHSVCLEHGKPDPAPRMSYQLMPVEQYTSDPVLQELVGMIARGALDPAVAQAATWHLSDKMSWQELAAKRIPRLGGAPSEPYFTAQQLRAAQNLVAQAAASAREKRPADAPSPSEASASNRTIR